MNLRSPSYRLHKASGQAVVTIDGREIYLGKHGTSESLAKYDRLIAEWLLNGRRLSPSEDGLDLTVNEMCRTQVNGAVRRIVRVFKWAVENEWISPSVHQALKSVPGLRRGRTEASESEPIRPVPEAFVDAIQLYVAPQVWSGRWLSSSV